MRGRPKNRYSIYEAGTDRPICIYATAEECAKALGVELCTFYSYVRRCRAQYHAPQKIQIYKDDIEEDIIE